MDYNNLLIRSILDVYNRGGFYVATSTSSYLIYANNDGDLAIKTRERATDNKESISMILSYIFYAGLTDSNDIKFETRNDKDTRVSELSKKSKAINQMYNVYMAMLREENTLLKAIVSFKSKPTIDTIKQILLYCKTVNFDETDYQLDYILSSIGALFSKWKIDYKMASDIFDSWYMAFAAGDTYASQENKRLWESLWESESNDVAPKQETKKKKKNSKTKNSAPKNSNIKKGFDTLLLRKNNIPFEILNDREFNVDPAIGREEEIRSLGATLLSQSLSPIILGESGVGKTAVIEGFAYRIKTGEIVGPLANKKIIKISPSSVVSGCMFRGQFEERMQNIIKYFIENKDAVLYIDEVHSAAGVGRSDGNNNDMLNILKPYLENGSIKLICATTKREYEEYLLGDTAFTRRLKPITVDEPDNEVLRSIIIATINKNELRCGIGFCEDKHRDAIIDILIDTTSRTHRNYKEVKYNPGLVISIIEEAFGYAMYDGLNMVGPFYLIDAISKCEDIYSVIKDKAIARLNRLDESFEPKCKIIEFKPKKENK